MEKIEEIMFKQIIDNQERVIEEQKEDIKRLQSELNKQIKDNRKLVKALKEIRNWLHNEFSSGWKKIGKEYFFLMEPDWAQTNYNDIVDVLKEIEEV